MLCVLNTIKNLSELSPLFQFALSILNLHFIRIILNTIKFELSHIILLSGTLNFQFSYSMSCRFDYVLNYELFLFVQMKKTTKSVIKLTVNDKLARFES